MQRGPGDARLSRIGNKGRPSRAASVMAMAQTKQDAQPAADAAHVEEEVAYLAKRHRISPAIVREIIRRIGSAERSAVEREIRKGLARR